MRGRGIGGHLTKSITEYLNITKMKMMPYTCVHLCMYTVDVYIYIYLFEVSRITGFTQFSLSTALRSVGSFWMVSVRRG